MKHKDHLIWIDLEMTGLEPEHNKILEIATIVTDSQLTILEEGPVLAINQPQALLDQMDTWNNKHHTQSGLVKRVQESSFSEKKAEQLTLRFVSQYLDKGQSPMCGNSICLDRRFLCRYMPELARFFHYRNLDVSTLKELAKRWRPDIMKGVEKESKHLALDDIRESIAELIYYREHFISIPKEKNSDVVR
ncbi:MAG: oligoribonuclease [Gammaproteobacteria bacterium]|nr:oligoribonuclease [Gammaproteobacteria bacterium]